MHLTLPNILTLSRILVIPFFVALFYIERPFANWTLATIFILACITDFLDGYFARSRKQISNFGRFLDPIADKLLIATALLMLVGTGQLGGISLLPTVIILCREILVSGLREFLAELKVSVPVSQLAKWKTAIQMCAIISLLVGEAGDPFFPFTFIGLLTLWSAALLTLFTGYDYFQASLEHFEKKTSQTRNES
ncbi:MAG: CDP-diacylglycerol--glycerol-3-phosphate 3-phosphatidyltransferase [Alphaproteobacteria bacterium]|nr:CDP-diacylglycerol--glycerol-3-phosphate 3-phosphatidyltransferase [Alphaproteobacteria bacterium]MBT5389912.1 CDP-diacylglycerol--glycerol-3-phosphate 3-phosphatidyltransferase [Alphaproteobacteria bacterium]MBT5540641.1 CDP-diacylglycerol--glycerol-3-phosphate 3-phosphatidyltransferase [Alphaproteobacteria bacterium]